MVARDISAYIERIGGQLVTVYERSAESVDEFNNTEWGFDDDLDGDGEPTEALCARTYPNRNTEAEGVEGDRKQDVPLFMFPLDEWEKVGPNARIGYTEHNGSETVYELKSPTRWPTHVEVFAEEVVN